jgi:pimeloyl-ACP methyl ester carboxylesterase
VGGIAPDLPGFGRSGKPAGFDYSIGGYERFLRELLEHLEVDRFSLVVHDWGGVGLALAQAAPDRLERLVIVNCVPLLPGYRWHRVARIWRTPLIGELSMGLTTRPLFRLLSREARVAPGPMPEAFVESAWRRFDHGTQRAILRLYRSAPPDVLEAAGDRLDAIASPALVLWGEQDPYVPAAFATAYADRLGGPVDLELLPDAGHWPWIDRPEAIDRVVRFLLDQEAEPSRR